MAVAGDLSPPRVPFDVAEADRCYDVWGFNCGPAAICAVTGKSPEEIRAHLGDFESKRYTNPTLMLRALRSMGISHVCTQSQGPTLALEWPKWGLVRIQWAGPWTRPGVPIPARYRHTHWVATHIGDPGIGRGVFDINAIEAGGWIPFWAWKDRLVPLILESVPRSSGDWWPTHSIELEDRSVG